MEQLDNLPDEVLLNIFSFFNKRDHGQASTVNKRFYKVSMDQSLNNLPWPLLDYSQPPSEIKTLIDNQGRIHNFVITSNGKILFNSSVLESDNSLTRTTQVYDPKRNECQKLQHLTLDTRSNLFPLANDHVIVISREGMSKVDITQESYTHLKGPTAPITAVTELPNGHLVSASEDNSLKVWDIAKGECLSTISIGINLPIRHLLTLSNGLVAGAIDGKEGAMIGIWDITLGKRLHVLRHTGSNLTRLFALPAGELLSVGKDGTIKHWDVLSKTCLHTFKVPDYFLVPNLIVGLPNKNQIMIIEATHRGTFYWIWDIDKRKLTDSVTVNYSDSSFTSFAVLPSGQIVTIGGKSIKCWSFPELTFENKHTEIDSFSNLSKLNLK